MACEGDRRLEKARLEAVVFPEFPPLSCMVHTREPSGPTSNSTAAPTLGLLEASKEARSHLNQQDILTAPLTDSLALPECTVSPPLPFSPLLGCMHCLYCTEKGRDSRSEEERMERRWRSGCWIPGFLVAMLRIRSFIVWVSGLGHTMRAVSHTPCFPWSLWGQVYCAVP